MQYLAIPCCTVPYLIFVIFLHKQNFWRIKFIPKKTVNYGKIHSKLPIFCVITAKYTVNCQFFALNLWKFTPAKKNLHKHARGARDKYQAIFCSWPVITSACATGFGCTPGAFSYSSLHHKKCQDPNISDFGNPNIYNSLDKIKVKSSASTSG